MVSDAGELLGTGGSSAPGTDPSPGTETLTEERRTSSLFPLLERREGRRLVGRSSGRGWGGSTCVSRHQGEDYLCSVYWRPPC